MNPIRLIAAASLVLSVSIATAAETPPAAAAKTRPAAKHPGKPAAAKPAPPTAKVERLSHGRFRDVTLYRPEGTPTSFVLFLSGDGGWNAAMTGMVTTLVAKGALVAGISTPRIVAEMEQDGGDCGSIVGDLENLSHFIQAYDHLPTYLAPILAGYSSGATLAYATLVQSPRDTFTGALTLGFCADLNLHKPMCKDGGIESRRRGDGTGIDLLPAKQLPDPWINLQGSIDQACELPLARSFTRGVENVELVELPKVGHGFLKPEAWLPQYEAAFEKLRSAPSPKTVPAPPASLGNLPVIEIPAKPGVPEADSFALLISGDGGWAGIDKEVAASLSAKGIPVVGLDSLRYFWTPRTPEGLATDVDKILRYYLGTLKKQRAIFIGYSQGADVLPFALSRLEPAVRAQVAEAAVMGLSDNALFEFHLTNWVGDDNSGIPTLPEFAKLKGVTGSMPLLCIYGEDDEEALCPKLDPAQVKVVKLKGGHHFGGDYDRVAQEIIAGLPAAVH